jgi:hypothetical protein
MIKSDENKEYKNFKVFGQMIKILHQLGFLIFKIQIL